MSGRIPIINVQPVVECGRWPARAVVGERFPVTATVFREGHDAVNANVVLTDPDGKTGPLRPDAPAGSGHRPMGHRGRGGPGGRVELHRGGLGRPGRHLAARRRPSRSRPGWMSSSCWRRGRASWPGRPPWTDPRRPGVCSPTPPSALRDTTRPVDARLAAGLAPEVDQALAGAPLRELLTASDTYPLWIDRERALYGAWYEFFPRSEGAVTDPETGRAALRHPGHGRRTAARRAGHAVRRRLPPADPPDRADQPQGPQQHPHPRAGRPRLAVGHRCRRGRARRDPPGSGDHRGLRRLRGPYAGAGHGGGAGPRDPGRPRPPVGRGAPGMVLGRWPTARSPTPRTRRRSTRTSIRSTSTATPRGSTTRSCASPGIGWTTACASSGSTTRTPSRSRSGSG